VEIARQNLDYALEKPELAAKILPGIKMLTDAPESR